jgi:O-methyltransferase
MPLFKLGSFTHTHQLTSQILFALAQVPSLAALARYPTEHGPVWVRESVARFKRRHRRRAYAMVPEKKFRTVLRVGLRRLIERVGRHGLGDYLEFGVHSCSSLLCMYRELEALRLTNVRLFGFDSFEGLPVSDEPDDIGRWNPGDFASDYEFALKILEDERVEQSRVFLTRGFFSDTLTPEFIVQHRLSKASVIMVDCDQYIGAKQALTFCRPLLRDHALVLFDDWHSGNLASRNQGEKRAFDEFLAGDEFTIEPVETYTANAAVFLVSRRAAIGP